MCPPSCSAQTRHHRLITTVPAQPYNAITTAAKAAWVDKKGAYDAEHAGDAPIVAPPPVRLVAAF